MKSLRMLFTGLLMVGAMTASVLAAGEKLPFVLFGEGAEKSPYIASGWMGNTGGIAMDDKCETKPHSGKTCLKVEYKENDNWAGVVWQSPANDWGDQPGGYNLTGATKLTFWARGEKGGEKVKFGFGLIGSDKKYPDSGKGETPVIELTTEWKQYTIELKGKDLTSIKSGFYWTLGGQGSPIVFYLADCKYE